jgi:hypothetical protein
MINKKQNLLIKIDEAIYIINKMLLNDNNFVDNDNFGIIKNIQITLSKLKYRIEKEEKVDIVLLQYFDRVLSVSVRSFEGTHLDDLLWEINNLLNPYKP